MAGLWALALVLRKVADDHKLMKTQEEFNLLIVWLISQKWAEIGTLYVQAYEQLLERLVGGVIFEDGRHYTFVYEDEDFIYEEEVWRFLLKISEELANLVEQNGLLLLFCWVDCGDCR